jgi:hypothetical protein
MELPPPVEKPTSPTGWVGLGLGIAAAAGAAVGTAAWEAWRWLDDRAVARDPEHLTLSEPPRGEPLEARTADGVRLAGELFGPRDAPPVVLVHGWTCARRFWTYQVHALAERHRVIAYDLRGHGESSAHDRCDFSTDALADDLQAVLEAAVPDGRRALLVGHSLRRRCRTCTSTSSSSASAPWPRSRRRRRSTPRSSGSRRGPTSPHPSRSRSPAADRSAARRGSNGAPRGRPCRADDPRGA